MASTKRRPAPAASKWGPADDSRPQPRDARADPGGPPVYRRVRRGVRPGELETRQPQPHLRRLLLRALPGDPPLPADPPAARRSLPLPADGAADRVRAGDDLPDRRKPRPGPGQLVRLRPRPLRPDDPVPA